MPITRETKDELKIQLHWEKENRGEQVTFWPDLLIKYHNKASLTNQSELDTERKRRENAVKGKP